MLLLDLLSWTVTLFGVVSLAFAVLALGQFLRTHFLRAPTSFSVYGAGDATWWALVTGASDGIGKQYAIQLVRRTKTKREKEKKSEEICGEKCDILDFETCIVINVARRIECTDSRVKQTTLLVFSSPKVQAADSGALSISVLLGEAWLQCRSVGS
jgi:hypothetical protein